MVNSQPLGDVAKEICMSMCLRCRLCLGWQKSGLAWFCVLRCLTPLEAISVVAETSPGGSGVLTPCRTYPFVNRVVDVLLIEGAIPTELGKLASLEGLYLECNQLTGE